MNAVTPMLSRLEKVVLDPETMTALSPYIEADREQAIADLTAENHFTPLLHGAAAGPFVLHLSIREGRLVFDIRDRDDQPLFAIETQECLEAELALVFPLVLVGPTGSGKTHLINLLRDAWSRDRAAAEIVIFAAIDYAREYRDANQQHTLAWWRSQQRNAALLVIEEIGVLCDHAAAQLELIQTLDERADRALPTVITSRRPIDASLELLPELLSRVEEGGSGHHRAAADCNAV